jgi:hypothetical protein
MMMSPYTMVAPRTRVGGYGLAAPVRVGATPYFAAAPRAFMAPRQVAAAPRSGNLLDNLFGNMDADIADYIMRGNLGGLSLGTDLGLEATETAVWNMQKAGAFGGDVPDAALLTLALQNKNDINNPLIANNLAFTTAMGGLAGNEYWNGADDTHMDAGVLGRLLEINGATGAMDTDFLAALLTSGPVLGLGSDRTDMSPFMMSLIFNSNNQYGNNLYASMMGQMYGLPGVSDIYEQTLMSRGVFGTGYMAGALPNGM